MTKGFIFDLDGVIVDTAKYHFLAWQRLAHSLDIAFDEEDNEQLKGVSRKESLQWILKKGGKVLSLPDFEDAMALKNSWYIDYVGEMNEDGILAGVSDFLAEAKNLGVKLAIGSSSKNARLILTRIGLLQSFQFISDGTIISHSKPHPEVFLKAAEGLNLHPSDCVVFEDAEAGVAAALAGGFKAVGVGVESGLQKAHVQVASFVGQSAKTFVFDF